MLFNTATEYIFLVSCLHRDAAIDKEAQKSGHVISWVSKQLMRDRNTGDFQNYGERLYVEALHDLERKQADVELLEITGL